MGFVFGSSILRLVLGDTLKIGKVYNFIWKIHVDCSYVAKTSNILVKDILPS